MKTLLKFAFSALMALCITNATHSMNCPAVEQRESDITEKNPLLTVPANFANEMLARLALIHEFLVTPEPTDNKDLSTYFTINASSLSVASALLKEQLNVLVYAAAEIEQCDIAEINIDIILELFFHQAAQCAVNYALKMQAELEKVTPDDTTRETLVAFAEIVQPWGSNLATEDQCLSVAMGMLLRNESVAYVTLRALDDNELA